MLLSLENIHIPKMFLVQHSTHTLSTSSRNYLVKANDVIMGNYVITHVQTIVGNAVDIVSPRDFGIRHIGIIKYRKLISASFYWPQIA
jgi:hypothetical protein